MNAKPTAFIFAGINGAGKSTLYYDELLKNKYFGTRINTDEFVSSFGSWKNPNDQFKAAKIALKVRQNCIQMSANFNQETTLCGKSILNLFKELKNKDYEIQLYYVGVNTPQIAKERVRARVAKGGHNIDERIIDKRFNETLRNISKVFEFCDKIVLFDNTKLYKKIFKYDKTTHCLENFITPNVKWLDDKILLACESCIHINNLNKKISYYQDKESVLLPEPKQRLQNEILKDYESVIKRGLKIDEKSLKIIQTIQKSYSRGI